MKKFAAFLFSIIVIFSFAGCALGKDDPMRIARKLIDEDFQVVLELDAINNQDTIEEMEDLFDSNLKGVYCFIWLVPEDGDDYGGFVFFCDKKSDAKKLEEDMIDFMDDYGELFTRGEVKRVGKACYVGCGKYIDYVF